MNSAGFFVAMSTTCAYRPVICGGEAFNPRRLPDCRLRYPRTGELPGPRSDYALQPYVTGERMASHEARRRGLIA
jgi:hypothetical protein